MNDELKRLAEDVRVLYKANIITRAEAKEQLKPYVEHYNQTAERLAKKYNQKPHKFNFNAFMR
jgi:hypothetical protein